MVPTNNDYSMQIVPEGFSPLDDRQSLGYHWNIWFVATFLVFQSFPLLREILHDWSPLKVCSSDGTADGIVEPEKFGSVNQSLLGLGPKCKGWCRNRGACSAPGLGSGTLPVGRRRLEAMPSMVSLSNSARFSTPFSPSVCN
jgi:hypothetical protein